MRRISPRSAGFLAAAMLMAGCGGSSTQHAANTGTAAAAPAPKDAWSDPSFQPSASKLMTVSVAPVPSTGSLAGRADQGFERVFVSMQGIQVRMTPTMVRQRMNGNRELVQIMNRIQTAQYTPSTLAAASLKTMFTGREYADLNTALGEPVVTCVPVQFAIDRTGKETRGAVSYRAFDMESGRLLRQCSFAVQSALPAEEAEQKVLVDLILAVEGDFAAHFVAP
jgi:hypothetical protein